MNRDISLAAAFAAGVLSFLSPCVLPLVPGYISYVSGLSLEALTEGDQAEARRRALRGSVAFVFGFSLIFTLLGASASAVGRFLEAWLPVLSKLAGAVVVLFGLHMIGVVPIKWLYYEKRFQSARMGPGLLGPCAMGMAFAFGWTPCIGPILAGILALAAGQGTVFLGMLLLFVYSMGLGIPFILTGLGTASFLRFFKSYKRYIRWGEITAGLLLVCIGALIFSHRLTLITRFFPRWLYQFSV